MPQRVMQLARRVIMVACREERATRGRAMFAITPVLTAHVVAARLLVGDAFLLSLSAYRVTCRGLRELLRRFMHTLIVRRTAQCRSLPQPVRPWVHAVALALLVVVPSAPVQWIVVWSNQLSGPAFSEPAASRPPSVQREHDELTPVATKEAPGIEQGSNTTLTCEMPPCWAASGLRVSFPNQRFRLIAARVGMYRGSAPPAYGSGCRNARAPPV